jgi:chromosome segregation ATPase
MSITEVERLRIEISEFEKRYSLMINEKSKEIDLYKQRLSEYESNRGREFAEYTAKIRALEVKNTDLENKLSMVATENERLQNSLRSKNDEIESWRSRCSEIDSQRRREIEEYENRFRQFQVKYQELENKVVLLSTEN